jgi:chromosome segregation ATPase
MGSDLSPIDPAVLNWVEYWYPIAWEGLLVAVLITVIGAIGSIGFLLLQWRTSSIREQLSNRRISVLEFQAKKSDTDLERAKADIADADALAAGAQADATRATERAAALEADAAKAHERITTLDKEAAAAKATIADADARATGAQLARERAKADIADADARTAGAQADATPATERAAVLEADVAKAHERITTLEREAAAAEATIADADTRAAETQLALEKFEAPRTLTLEQQARITAAVMPYGGQEYTLSVGSGSEAENLLCAIDAALTAAQWKRIPPSHSITVDTKCGTVGLTMLSGVSIRLSDSAETEQQWNVLELVNALRAEGIAVDGAIDPENASLIAIAVMVGIKPY